MAACDTNNYDEDTLLAPENADDAYGWFVHHPKHSTPLYEQCLLVHDECQIATKIMHEGAQADPEQRAAANIQSFMTARLTPVCKRGVRFRHLWHTPFSTGVRRFEPDKIRVV